MRHSYLDRFSRLSSPIHGTSILVKLSMLIVLLLGTVAVPVTSRGVFVGVGVFLLAATLLSRIPLVYIVHRMALLELFVIGISVLSLFQPNGLNIFLGLLARSSLCLFAIVLFSNTTPFSDLLDSLKRWRVPSLIITLLALMYRYLFVFVDELERMQRARASRTFTHNKILIWQSLATVVSQLFVRSTERAERIYAAMCARGWQ